MILHVNCNWKIKLFPFWDMNFEAIEIFKYEVFVSSCHWIIKYLGERLAVVDMMLINFKISLQHTIINSTFKRSLRSSRMTYYKRDEIGMKKLLGRTLNIPWEWIMISRIIRGMHYNFISSLITFSCWGKMLFL